MKGAEAQLLLITSAGTVVMVDTVTGVTSRDCRVAITGCPDPAHPLIGQPDPWTTAPLTRSPTAPSRRRRPRLHQTLAGTVGPHPTKTDPADWPEFVTLALAGAAANLGGVDAALAGRPGSWEAAKAADLLYATVGPDQADLWEHRTEPVRHVIDADELHSDRTQAWSQYDDAEQLIYDRQIAAENAGPVPDRTAHGRIYNAIGPNQPTAVDAAAPEWSWDAWRAHQSKGTRIDDVESRIHDGSIFFTSLFIPHSPEAAAESNTRANWTKSTVSTQT